MTTRDACPPDEDLWPLAVEEPCDESVRTHVADCHSCQSRIARLRREVAAIRGPASAGPGAITPATDDWGTPDPDASTVESGSAVGRPGSIGKYAVIGELDEGGQAIVYRVVHRELLKELVLKLAKRPLQGPADRDALVAEGRLLVELDHPSLVRIFDLDFDEGRPYLVMEYVPGMNLRQWLAQGRPSPREAARVVAALARAAGEAHRRGVVHRDIKPKNALIDRQGRARLIDFGMARLRDAWSDGDDGPRGGTVAYMAPEQARGEWDQVGPAADVFALGGVLYFLLTGKAPYAGPNLGVVLARARECDFDREALRASGVPKRLERTCLAAMAAEPLDRPASADELAEALERFARPARARRMALVASTVLLASVVGLLLLPKPASTPSIPADALIGSMEVDLYRREPWETLGIVGSTAFAGHFDDDARVAVRLAEPAYSYLIALNPDGRDQLCDPPNETAPPKRSARVDHPADPESGFALNDGVGLQAFVLVASRVPLPPYREWKARLGPLPWSKTTNDLAWRFDGHRFQSADARDRGTVRELSGLPRPFADACRVFRQAPGIEAIRAIAFPIKPRTEPAPPAKSPVANP